MQIFVWSLKTGRLLDILAGHQGPVAQLAFSPTLSLLVSGSWDKTVRYAGSELWDLSSAEVMKRGGAAWAGQPLQPLPLA